MSEIILQVRVTVNDSQVIKMNAKRLRLGRQTRTGAEDAINAIGEALQHNLMFEQPIRVEEVVNNTILTVLKNSGIDVECGACMEVAFTSVTTNVHTCSPTRVLQDEEGHQFKAEDGGITG